MNNHSVSFKRLEKKQDNQNKMRRYQIDKDFGFLLRAIKAELSK
jgi:hypothetical protein